MKQLDADAATVLRRCGVRPSVQRVAVMDYLLKHRTHPTAEEVYGALAPQMPTLSKTTVYNTLNLLVERGAACHLTIEPGCSRFDGDTSPHGHLYCTACGGVYDLFFDEMPRLPMPEGHRIETVQLYYRGVCRDCAKKNVQNN